MSFKSHSLISPFMELSPNYFPRKELEALMANPVEAESLLLEALEDFCEEPDAYFTSQGNYLHVVAFNLLGHFKAVEAWPHCEAIINELYIQRPYEPQHMDILNETEINQFGKLVAGMARKNLDDLIELALDKELDLLVRKGLVIALFTSFLESVLAENRFFETLNQLFKSYSKSELGEYQQTVWDSLFFICSRVDPQLIIDNVDHIPKNHEKYQVILEASQKGFNPEESTVLTDKKKEALKQEHGYSQDPIYAMEDWKVNLNRFEDQIDQSIFNTMIDQLTQAVKNDTLPKLDTPSVKPQVPRRVTAKIGRNDPCLCESGKKYKKCCGK
ncbi:DUF1186 domain-containing protein [Parashewanella hymeniacidonis]|uniref:DUF1186 domain-containing protein n=1 Tax=Parashewanella hymeniacidonis TaxID=2807618 RepID=UPI001EF47928|nr:DUF1186 domain-containing protein [Parashewanella hymeniacidonis]